MITLFNYKGYPFPLKCSRWSQDVGGSDVRFVEGGDRWFPEEEQGEVAGRVGEGLAREASRESPLVARIYESPA